jgi:uncharacterized protein (DUF1778 family)
MQQSPKDARIAARVSPAVKETLQKAADLSGATLNQFLVQAALKEAHQILETERTIVLSERDAQIVFDLLERPPAPTDRFKAAVNKHQAFSRENHRAAQ